MTKSSAGAPARGWLRRLAAYCWRYRGSVLLAFGAALAGMAVQAGVPLVERLVVDQAVLKRTQPLLPWVLVLVGAGFARFAFSFIRRYVGGRLSLDVQHDLRTEVFGALHRLDGASQDELNTGQVVSRSISDITLVQGLLSFLPMMSGNFLLFIISLVIMLVLSPLLTLVAVAVGPALWFIAIRSRRRLFPATWAAQQQAGDLAGVVEAAVTGVRVVKGFGQEDRELGRLEGAAKKLFALRLRAVRLTARYNPALQAVPAHRAGRRAALRRLARRERQDHARYVPRLLDLCRPAGRPGPDARRPAHRGAAGPGERRARLRGHRLHPQGRRRSGRRRAAAGAGPGRVRRRVVRLHRLASGAARARSDRRAGRDARARRRRRLRQVDHLAAAAALLRRAVRRGPGRRHRRARDDDGVATRADRRRLRRELPVQRHRRGQHRLRASRRERRADPRRRRALPRPTASSARCRTATRPWSASRA